MYQGKTINELARQMEVLRDQSHDYVVPPQKLGNLMAEVIETTERMGEAPRATPAPEMRLTMINGVRQSYRPTPWAHSQLAAYSDVPKAYYDRLNAENPRLLADNVNHGFSRAATDAQAQRGSSGRMVRTVDDTLRAFVSGRYRRLDNWALFEAIVPTLIDLQFEPQSCELTDKRMYIKVTSPKLTSEIKVGDPVQFGLVVSGSDVGAGSVRVEALVYRLVCSNGMISSAPIRKAHLGRNLAGDDIDHLLTDATREVTDQAFFMQVRDVTRSLATQDAFEVELNRIRDASEQRITMYDFPEIVERAAKAINVIPGEAAKASIIDNLANGADGAGLNKWGLANAFTVGAQHPSLDYDQATNLERSGSKILEMSVKQWEVLNTR